MQKSTTKKALKIIGIVIAAIALIAIGALVYINRNAGEIASDLVQNTFAKSNFSKVYDMEYQDLDVSIFSGNIKLTNFKLSPKPGFYSAGDSIRFANPLLVDLLIPKFIIKDIDVGENLNLNDISIGSVVIDNPQIKLISHLNNAEKEKLRKRISQTVKDTLKKAPSLEEVEITRFVINRGKFVYYSHVEQKNVFDAGEINVDIKNIFLQPGNLLKAILTKTFDESSIQIKDLRYPLAGGFYDIHLGKVDVVVEDGGITLHDFALIPKYSKEEFGKIFGKQTDRFDVKVKKIAVINLNIGRLLLGNGIEAPEIILSGIDANIYRDKNIPFDFSKFPKFPHQSLGQVKGYLNIGVVKIKKSKLLYEELAPGSDVPGTVPISDLYASIYNVTNSKSVIDNNGPLKWDVQAKLFDVGELSLIVDFPKDFNENSFSFSGKMGEMDMTAFNQITVPNEHLKIEKGTIKSMEFSARANNDFSTGSMVMNYSDLKIDVLKGYKKKEQKKLVLVSSLANVMIRSFNPGRKGDKEPEPAEIFFERNKNKGIINYLVKSLISGIKGSMIPGFGMTLEKFEKQKEKEARKETKKEKRQRKKEERKH